MHQARIALILVPIALAGCASSVTRVEIETSKAPRTIAWDGLGQDPNRTRRAVTRIQATAVVEDDATRKREEVIASLRPYSAAWWAVHDEIEAERERRLARKLVICRGCLDPSGEEHTASIPVQ